METFKAIAVRKSSRAYLDKQITDEALSTILGAGSRAPVGRALYDTLHYTVVQDADVLAKINKDALAAAGNPDGNPPLYGAPTFIVVSTTAEMSKDIGIANVACVVDHMQLAATELGLGSVYIWGCLQPFRHNSDLAKVFDLPEGYVPVSGLAVGYPQDDSVTEKALDIGISVNYIK